MNLISISAFQDNYIWVLVDDDRRCIIVDPANPHRSCTRLKKTAGSRRRSFLPITITIMSAVFPDLLARYPHLPVYGPAETQDKGTTQVVEEGESILILGWEFSVFATPVTLPVISVSTANLICFVATRCFLAAVEGCLKARQNRCINLYKN